MPYTTPYTTGIASYTSHRQSDDESHNPREMADPLGAMNSQARTAASTSGSEAGGASPPNGYSNTMRSLSAEQDDHVSEVPGAKHAAAPQDSGASEPPLKKKRKQVSCGCLDSLRPR